MAVENDRPNEPSEEEWDSLITAILKKKCILVLGPKAAVDPRDPSKPVLPVQLAQHLILLLMQAGALPEKLVNTQGDSKGVSIDNLAFIAQYYKREFKARKLSPRSEFPKLNELTYVLKNFYDPVEDQTTSLHQNLAALPFCICLSVTQDRMMVNALREAGKSPNESWYSLKERRIIDAGEFTADSPLVYHLLGRASDRISVVLTQDDMMDLVIGLTRTETSIDAKLLGKLRDEDMVFLFVGFGFGSTYSKFLLKLLSNRQSEDESRDFFFEDVESADNRVALLYQDSPASFFRTSLLQFTEQLRQRLAAKSNGTAPKKVAALSPSKRPVVFLCHCSDDKEKIGWMPAAFQAQGIECWMDKDGLRGGDNWDSRIRDLIENTFDYFVVLASAAMLQHTSKYFYKEIKLGLEKRALVNENFKYIFPVVLHCPETLTAKMLLGKINGKLSDWQAIDFRKDQEREFQALVSDINDDWKERLAWQQI